MTIGKASARSIQLAGAAGVAFLVTAVAAWLGPQPLRDEGWAVAGTASLLVFAFFVRQVIRWFGRQELFSPLIAFPITYAAWFAVGSLTLDDGQGKILLYSGAGLACYVTGALLAGWRSVLRPPRPTFRNEWDRSRFWFVIGTFGVLTVLSYAYVISQVGIIALDPEAAERRADLVKYGPVEAILFTASWTVLIFIAVYLWTERERPLLRKIGWASVFAVALILLSLGSRGYLFVPLLTAVIARHYLRKKFHVATLLAIGVVVFMALSFYGFKRDSTLSSGKFSLKGGNATEMAIYPLIYAYLYVSQPVWTLQEVTRVIPRTIPYQNGQLTFDALRTLLPGHHEMSDMFFKQILGSDFVGGGQPATLLGPLYGDFGLFGILVGMFIVGIVIARTYSWMVTKPTVLRVVMYSWAMQTVLFSLFGALIPYITTLWIPVFWWFLDSSMLRKQSFAPRSLPFDSRAALNP
jgi:oligosaccharide repeat unit polymerase